MKITCQSCQAKYTIADEKVAGKTVKIKCKKCGATIVVSGTDAAVAAPAAAPMMASGPGAPPGDDDEGEGATRVFSEGAGQPPGPDGGGGGGEEWTVNVTDEDQRTLTAPQIVIEFQRGVVTNDTYVWKDGMADWLPLCDVPELVRMVSVVAPRPAAGAPAPMAMPAPQAGGYAQAPAPQAYAQPGGYAPEPGAAFGGTMIMNEQAPSPMAMPSPAISPAAAAAPAAARRSGKAGGVDLFAPGQREAAPAASMSTATTSADRLVGERNENSVLFSISALTAAAGAGKNSDDPFDLGAPSPPRNGRGNVDDIMNLAGGMSPGMSAPMLAPPQLMAPVVEAPPPPPPPRVVAAAPAMQMNMGMPMGAQPMGMTPDYPQPRSKAPLIIGVIAALAVFGGVGVFFATRGGPTAGGAENGSTVATPTQTVAAATVQAAPPPVETTKPAETTPVAVTTTPSATPVTAPVNPGRTVAGNPQAKVEPKAEPKAEPKPDPKPEPEAKKPEPEAKKPDAKPDPGGGGNGKEFDRAAAMSALSAMAGAARGCKKDDTGSARVRVTFAPSGSVTSASVEGQFAGTPVGGCIAAAFRGAHVPAFDGSSVTVTKTVTIN